MFFSYLGVYIIASRQWKTRKGQLFIICIFSKVHFGGMTSPWHLTMICSEDTPLSNICLCLGYYKKNIRAKIIHMHNILRPHTVTPRRLLLLTALFLCLWLLSTILTFTHKDAQFIYIIATVVNGSAHTMMTGTNDDTSFDRLSPYPDDAMSPTKEKIHTHVLLFPLARVATGPLSMLCRLVNMFRGWKHMKSKIFNALDCNPGGGRW